MVLRVAVGRQPRVALPTRADMRMRLFGMPRRCRTRAYSPQMHCSHTNTSDAVLPPPGQPSRCAPSLACCPCVRTPMRPLRPGRRARSVHSTALSLRVFNWEVQ